MQNINSAVSLRNAIEALEHRQTCEGRLLKEQLHLTYENLKPLNVIKNTLKEASSSSEMRQHMINASMGWVANYLSHKLFESDKATPMKKFVGTAVMFGITEVVTKHPDVLKALGNKLINLFTNTLKTK